MARMTERELTTAIYSELDRATQYADTQLRDIRKQSWDRHLVRPIGNELEGRSSILDTTIPDTTESIMSILTEQWATENICDFAPEGQGDEDQADAEARALNTLFWSDNNGYLAATMAAKNALMFRNGILKVYLDRDPLTEVRVFEDAAALAAIPEEIIRDQQETEDGVQVTLEIPQQRLVFQNVEPAYFYIDPNVDSNDMQRAGFVAERTFFTRAELKDMGIPRGKIAKLQQSEDESVTDGIGSSNTDITAKFIDGQNDRGPAATLAEQRIECFWCWMRVDLSGGLNPQLWRFLVSGNNLLKKDPATHIPFATGCPWMVPNRWSGLGVYDKLWQTSKMRTNAIRQMADNMNYINNPRPAADPAGVEFNDLLVSAPGRPIRKKRADAMIEWQPVLDLVSNSLAFLNYTDTLRSNQAGASLDMQSADAQSVKNISGISAELQLGPAEQMSGMIARNLAETLLKNAFLIAHRIVREQWRGPITFYKAGEWEQTKPASWRVRKRIHLNLAMSPGEARRKIAALNELIQTQMMLIQGGAANIAVDYSGLHKALTDKLRLQRLDDTEGYLIDPDSQASQQAQAAQAESAQMQAQMQQQIMQLQMQLEQAKLREDARQHDTELQYKYYDTNLDAEVKEADLSERAITNARKAAGTNGSGEGGRTSGGTAE